MKKHDTFRPSTIRLLASALILGAALLPPASAQQAAANPSAELDRSTLARAASGGFGLQRYEGRLMGTGRGYRAEFEPGRIDFLPALGEKAEHEMPLAFELQDIRVGESVLHVADPSVLPDRDGHSVHYRRGSSIVEQYDVTSDGVLQSFLFEEPLPVNGGDLVVRGRLDTDLPAPVVLEDGSLCFDLPGVGGVTFGAVTGIDADGVSVAGSLRSDGETIELVLPGDFVASAAYPLLLDPVIAPFTAVNDAAFHDRNPDISFGGSRVHVVWERVFSADSVTLLHQRLTLGGDLHQGINVISTGQINTDPTAAHVDASNQLLIAWTYAHALDPAQTFIAARNIDLSNSDLGATIAVHAAGGVQTSVRVGGDDSGGDDEVFVVWAEEGTVQGRLLTVADAGVSHGGPVILIDDPGGSQEAVHPDISESVYDDGDFLVVWERRNSGTGVSQIWGRAYDRNGNAIGIEPDYLSSEVVGARSSSYPSCDGDGKTFIVAYERSKSIFGSVDTDIVCKSVTIRSDGLEVSVFPRVLAESDDSLVRPCVSTTSNSTIVAWLKEWFWFDVFFYPAYSLFATSVDLYTGRGFGEIELAHDGDYIDDYGMVSIAAGDSTLYPMLYYAWGNTEVGAGQSDVMAGRFFASQDTFQQHPGCGASGVQHVENAVAGNSKFRIHLRDSAPGSLAVLVIGGMEEAIPCGPCVLVPKLESVYYASTNTYGDASVEIPIGIELAGVTFYSQWAVFAPGGACSLVDLNLSRALETEIGTQL